MTNTMFTFDGKSNLRFYDMFQIDPLKNILRDDKISKIDVNSIRKYTLAHSNAYLNAEHHASQIDFLKLYQSILSKRLTPEIANGMINLIYAVSFPNATTENRENAVVK